MGYIYIQNPNDHTAAGSGMNSFLPKILVFSGVPAKIKIFQLKSSFFGGVTVVRRGPVGFLVPLQEKRAKRASGASEAAKRASGARAERACTENAPEFFFLRASARKREILLCVREKSRAKEQPADVNDVELS